MPNHCYSTAQSIHDEQRGPVYYDWDWTVDWNQNLWGYTHYGGALVNTQEKTDNLLCYSSITRKNQLTNSITFNQGADIENAVGVTIGGMLIFNSLDGGNGISYDSDLLEMDDFSYFQDYFDSCLSYIDEDNLIGVRTLSPCTKTKPQQTAPGSNTRG